MNQEPGIVLGYREHLFHLLAEAAEIEHSLMCSYLYAAFSLKTRASNGLSESHQLDVWRDAIMGVAIEEMAHLVLVSNLTLAVGGSPHVGRPNFPAEAGYFPSGVVVKLTPFSMETLEHFIQLERPQGYAQSDAIAFKTKDTSVRKPIADPTCPAAGPTNRTSSPSLRALALKLSLMASYSHPTAV